MLKEKLRTARKAAGKTQKEIADLLGISESAYCGYETGKRQPDAVKIKKIASFLNVSGDYLLETGFDEPQSKPESTTKQSVVCTEAEEIRLLTCYRQLNIIGKSVALAIIEGMTTRPELKQESSATVTA